MYQYYFLMVKSNLINFDCPVFQLTLANLKYKITSGFIVDHVKI